MKKTFLIIFSVLTYYLGFGQNNPVQNLQWSHYYDYSNYRNIFSLYWNEPETPHNELIGYNIYRGNELYKFQTTTSVGCNPDWGVTSGCDFLTQAFTVYVKAVYEGNVESEAISYTINGPALAANDITNSGLTIFPNPAKDILNFSEEISNITISDLSGKVVKQIYSSQKSINVSKLSKGSYIITGNSKSGKLINQKFIKE